MKKIFIALCVLVAMATQAQEHIKFKNIPVDGTYSSFVSALKTNGSNGGSTIGGIFTDAEIITNFAGKEMYVFPLTTSQTKTVYSVVACSPIMNEWSSVNAHFEDLRVLFFQKYGQSVQGAKLSAGYYRSHTGNLEKGYVSVVYKFETEKGWIFLYIYKSSHQDIEAGSINVWYVDKANLELFHKEALSDI